MGIQVSKIGEFRGHQQSIYTLKRIDEKQFLSAGGGGMLVRWRLDEQDGKLLARLPEQIFSMALEAS
ncbi:MAG: WD40 repeat domain-containing protein, partial [Bacteroidota bacterium]|nr:WD40 repeat domain-containing protein [Bacteroidota bacterium]MDX5431923.1 WD40 repeat domain-containing protein [Bacteroidota bacterium]MDX5470638.1 WD40 repeat domain-containing protein [Bacteroidota bacterium]